MKKLSYWLVIWNIILPFILLSGCARVTESCKILLGTTSSALEKAKDSPTAQAEIFKTDYPSLYQQVFDLLKKKKLYIFLHSQKKHRIVTMNFNGPDDTTEVGIFFEEIKPQETRLIIASLSPTHLKMAAKIIFSGIEKEIKKEVSSANN